MKIIFPKDAPHNVSGYVLKYFVDKYGARGSRFGHICGRPKNSPKSIAIAQESLISPFGIIKETALQYGLIQFSHVL